MRQWIDIIAESISEPLPFTWTTKTDDYWCAEFDAAGERYLATITKEDGFEHPDHPMTGAPWYEFSFGLAKDGFSGTKVIGTNGQSFRIFATAIAAFWEFIESNQPELIKLSASKENVNRYPLYQRLAQRFDGKLRTMGYVPVKAPNHRYADVHKYFDSLAWRRS